MKGRLKFQQFAFGAGGDIIHSEYYFIKRTEKLLHYILNKTE